jgi:hypothetical protein
MARCVGCFARVTVWASFVGLEWAGRLWPNPATRILASGEVGRIRAGVFKASGADLADSERRWRVFKVGGADLAESEERAAYLMPAAQLSPNPKDAGTRINNVFSVCQRAGSPVLESLT